MNQPYNSKCAPSDSPTRHAYLMDAGFKTVRYEIDRRQVEYGQIGTYDWNAYSCKSNIAAYRAAGCSVIALLAYSPYHCNIQRGRSYPPMASVDAEAHSFVSDQITLNYGDIVEDNTAGERVSPYVMASDVGTTAVTDEVITTNYTQGTVLKTAHYPVISSTVRVWVDQKGGAGYEEWTKVDHIEDAADGAKVFMRDNHGRIAFRIGTENGMHGLVPAAGSSVKCNYTYYNSRYQKDIDYALDKVTGVISRITGGGMSVPIMSDGFSSFAVAEDGWNPGGISDYDIEVANMSDGFAGPSLNAGWSFDVTPTYTVDGTLNITAAASGVYILTQDIVGDAGDFELVAKIAASSSTGNVGLRIQGSNPTNDRLTVFRNNSGELNLSIYNGGSGTSSKMGWAWGVPMTIHVKKVGTNITAWAEEYQDSHNYLTGSISWTPAEVGFYFAGGASGSSISVDDWLVQPAYAPKQLEASGGKLLCTLGSGQKAYYAQDVLGSGSFELSLKIEDFAGTVAGGRVGFQLYDDPDNYLYVAMIYSTNRKFYVSGKSGGVTVGGGTDGFGEAEDVTLTANYNADTGAMSVTMRPKTDYATDRNFTMTGFAPVTMGLWFYSDPQNGAQITCKLDDWSLVTSAGMPDSVLVSYDRLDVANWKNYLADVCAAFADGNGGANDLVRHMEIWNEQSPASNWVWATGLVTYSRLLKHAVDAIHAENPDVLVSCGGWADSQIANHADLYDTILPADFDRSACHPYHFSYAVPGSSWVGVASTILTAMNANSDGAKPVWAGEVSVPAGALIGTGGVGRTDGPTMRRQAEYGLRLFMLMRQLALQDGESAAYDSFQYWPVTDYYRAGSSSANEAMPWGARDGLFYSGGEYAVPAGRKPIFFALKSLNTQKGILADTVSYSGNNPVPSDRKHLLRAITLRAVERAAIQAVKVYTSLTACPSAWPDDYEDTAVLIGGNVVFRVDCTGVGYLEPGELAVYTGVCDGEGNFEIYKNGVGDSTAIPGVLHGTTDMVCEFTIPSGSYNEGDTFRWEVFRGDDWSLAADWTNPGHSGEGDSEIVFSSNRYARYVKIEMTRAAGYDVIALKRFFVWDSLNNDVAQGKPYAIEGWQEAYKV